MTMDDLEYVAERLAGMDDPVALLQGLFLHAPVAFQIVAADGRVVVVNKAFRDIFEGPPPPGYNFLEDEHIDRQGFRPLFDRAFRGEAVQVPPHWYAPRTPLAPGRRVALEVSAFPLRDQAGKVGHIAVCFKDVSARLLLEEANGALAHREQELSATLRSIGDAVIATDPAGRVARMNAVAEALTAWPSADALGRPIDEVFRIVNEETRRPVESPVDRALREGVVVGLANHTLLLARDGAERAIADSAAPIFDDGGAILGVVLVFRDVTAERDAERERLRQEAALRRSEEMLRVALHASRSLAWSLDFATGKVVFSDNAAELGIDVHATQEERLRRVHPDDRPMILQALAAARRGEAPPAYTYRIQRGFDEEIRWVEARSTFVRDAEDRAVGAVGLAIDVTDRMRAAEMRVRAAELERQSERAREANRMKSAFLANMSHELRTPLNAIIGFGELLHDGVVEPASAEHRDFLASILASARHLLELINDVLDLSKIEAGKLELAPRPLDVAETIGEVCANLRPMAVGKRIQITVEHDPSIGQVELDPSRFRQVLYNYLSNALKFTPEGGSVVVRTTPEGDGAFRLEVEDTGVGIAGEDIDRLFVDFEQLEAGAGKKHGGTGLGLALTRRLVEAQGGQVGVSSRRGEGSVFHAVLPRRPAPAGEAGQ